jgi:hypothetical protein
MRNHHRTEVFGRQHPGIRPSPSLADHRAQAMRRLNPWKSLRCPITVSATAKQAFLWALPHRIGTRAAQSSDYSAGRGSIDRGVRVGAAWSRRPTQLPSSRRLDGLGFRPAPPTMFTQNAFGCVGVSSTLALTTRRDRIAGSIIHSLVEPAGTSPTVAVVQQFSQCSTHAPRQAPPGDFRQFPLDLWLSAAVMW